MATLEELVSTPGWQQADDAKRANIMSAWETASPEARVKLVAAGNAVAASPATPPPAATPTPSPQPTILPPTTREPATRGTVAGTIADYGIGPGTGALAAGLGAPLIAASGPFAPLTAGALFAGGSLLGRRGAKTIAGVEQASPAEEALVTGLDVAAPTIGSKVLSPLWKNTLKPALKSTIGAVEKSVLPAVSKATDVATKYTGLQKLAGVTARQHEVSEAMRPLEKAATSVSKKLPHIVEAQRMKGEAELAKLSRDAETLVRRTATQQRHQDVVDLVGPDPRAAVERYAPVGTDSGIKAAQESTIMYENLYGRRQKEFSDAFEGLRAKYMDNELNEDVAKQLGAKVDETLAYAKNFNINEKGVLGPLNRLKQYAREDAIPLTSEDLSRMFNEARAGGKSSAEAMQLVESAQAQAAALAEAEPLKKLTVGDLLEMKGHLQHFVTSTDGPTRHVAREGIGDIMDILSDLPITDRHLNALYKDWKRGFNKPTLRQMFSVQRAPELYSKQSSGLLNPKLTASLVDVATTAEKELLKQSIADTMAFHNLKFGEMEKILPPEVAAKLYGPQAANFSRWQGIDTKLDELDKLFTANPQLEQLYNREMNRGAEIAYRKLTEIQEKLVGAVSKIGGPGERKAQELALMAPEDALKTYFTDIHQKPEFFGGLLEQARREIPVRLGADEKPWFARHAGYYGTAAALGLLSTGYPPQYAGVALAAALGYEGSQAARRTFVRALESGPALRELMTRYAGSPWTRAKIAAFGRASGQILASDAMRKIASDVVYPSEAEAATPEVTPEVTPRPAATPPPGPPTGLSAPPTPNPAAPAAGAPQGPPNASPAGLSTPPPSSAPPPNPVQITERELALHEIPAPKLTSVHAFRQQFDDPKLVSRYNELVNKSLATRIEALTQLPQYRSADPKIQKRMLRHAIEWSKKTALGHVKPELGRLLKDRPMNPAAVPEATPPRVP